VVLLGDVNIDFLKYNSHQPTERYLDMLYENNFIPVITKPTWITDHTKTLIDHIYTNTPIDQVVSDIGLFDISDHLPVFCILRMSIKREYYKRFYRDYKHFSQDEYLHDLMHTNWNNKLNNLNDSLNQVTKDVIDTICELTDRHAPIKGVHTTK
jgi:hypothetical protein